VPAHLAWFRVLEESAGGDHEGRQQRDEDAGAAAEGL